MTRLRLRLLATLVVVACMVMAFSSLAGVATAALVVTNHSFEMPVVDPNGGPGENGWVNVMPDGWSGDLGQGHIVNGPDVYYPTGYTDTQAFLFDSQSNDGGPTDIYQDVGSIGDVASLVTLMVDVAARYDDPQRPRADYTVQLEDADSGEVLAFKNYDPEPSRAEFLTCSVTTPEVVPAGTSIRVRLFVGTTGGNPLDRRHTFMDNVRVTGGSPPTPIPGDANLDDIVNDQDASILAAHWQAGPGAAWGDGDFNDDGFVNDQDASILAAHWQETQEGYSAVPEPTTVVMLLGGLLSLLLWRRK